MMNLRSGNREPLWMIAGAVLLIAVVYLAIRYSGSKTMAEELASKEERLHLVAQVRLALASASEAEKSAVMAITDEDSVRDAEEAKGTTAVAEAKRRELGALLDKAGTTQERSLFDQFSRAFTDFQRVDKEVLDLAIKNTNLKAYGLTFGPATDAVNELGDSLTRIVEKSSGWPDAREVAVLALGASVEALRVETLLAPHIAEASDAKMDVLEASMNAHSAQTRGNLDQLSAQKKLEGDPDLQTATSAFDRFGHLKSQILTLSRENTNVRSVTLSLSEKRRVLLLCQDALAALQAAIQEEPVGGPPYSRPVSPR